MSDAFKAIPRDLFLGLPVLSWIALIVVVAMTMLIARSAIGRAFYAVGGNPTAAERVGLEPAGLEEHVHDVADDVLEVGQAGVAADAAPASEPSIFAIASA